jgi:predicted nuclease of predicted toxin-antitoxin system
MPSKKSRMQFYADECFPVTSVMELKSLGYSIVHAFDRKLIHKPDLIHLKESKKLKRALITLDRDFIYYEQVRLNEHPGVIVVSAGSATPKNINKICKKLLATINSNFIKNSLIKVTLSKIIKMKEGKIVSERKL